MRGDNTIDNDCDKMDLRCGHELESYGLDWLSRIVVP